MPALTKCPSCWNAISLEARSCPKCGQPMRRPVSSHSRIVIVGVVRLGLLIASVLA